MLKQVVALAIASVAVVGLQSPAFADCNIVDRNLDDTIRANAESRSVYHDRVVRDLRHLRNSAELLASYGRDDACQQIADIIKEMSTDPRTAVESRRDAIAEGDLDTGVSQAEIDASRIADARPMSDLLGRIRADELIGTDVRDRTGEGVGEIEDVLIGTQGDTSYVIVTHGGFLGIGEEQIAVPLDKLKMAQDLSAVFVGMTQAELESAPAFDRGKFDWVQDDAWRASNDEYYDTL